jgi:hypothetical protein
MFLPRRCIGLLIGLRPKGGRARTATLARAAMLALTFLLQVSKTYDCIHGMAKGETAQRTALFCS